MAEQKKQEQDTNQLLKVRREKLAELQANGKDPFQITKFNQTHHSLEVKEIYEAHEAELLFFECSFLLPSVALPAVFQDTFFLPPSVFLPIFPAETSPEKLSQHLQSSISISMEYFYMFHHFFPYLSIWHFSENYPAGLVMFPVKICDVAVHRSSVSGKGFS